MKLALIFKLHRRYARRRLVERIGRRWLTVKRARELASRIP